MVINTNMMAQSTANLLGASSQRLSQSLARLSSGSKINSPADDAAGLAVSMNFTAQIGRTDAANNNVANAASFSQTQDGYLQQVSNALNRMSELAVQAQDVTKSDSDRSLYNQEFQTLATYINGVGNKDFNGVSLFSGNDLNVTSDSEGGTFQMKGISGSFLPTVTQTSSSSTSGPMPTNITVGDLLPNYDSSNPTGFAAQDSSSLSGGGPLLRYSTLTDILGYMNTYLSEEGGGSASYDSTTGQLTITLAAGEKLIEGDDSNHSVASSNDIFAALGLSASELDNRAGSSSKTVTSQLTTAMSATREPYSVDSTLGEILGGSGSYPVQVNSDNDNNYSHTFANTDTLQDVVDFLNNETGGTTSAAYDSSTGQFTFTEDGNQETNISSAVRDCVPYTYTTNSSGFFIFTSSPLTHAVTNGSSDSSSSSSALDISTADDAKAALTTIKNAISTVASDRATIGSNMERLNSTSQELSTLANNLSAANSRITDVDVATESTNYAKENILVQTGTAMLAQANALPQSVLKLLG